MYKNLFRLRKSGHCSKFIITPCRCRRFSLRRLVLFDITIKLHPIIINIRTETGDYYLNQRTKNKINDAKFNTTKQFGRPECLLN